MIKNSPFKIKELDRRDFWIWNGSLLVSFAALAIWSLLATSLFSGSWVIVNSTIFLMAGTLRGVYTLFCERPLGRLWSAFGSLAFLTTGAFFLILTPSSSQMMLTASGVILVDAIAGLLFSIQARENKGRIWLLTLGPLCSLPGIFSETWYPSGAQEIYQSFIIALALSLHSVSALSVFFYTRKKLLEMHFLTNVAVEEKVSFKKSGKKDELRKKGFVESEIRPSQNSKNSASGAQVGKDTIKEDEASYQSTSMP